ncbi:MAG: polynucleotide adenylyltransferase PcnB [Gammaproteobacteria bacterium]
MINKHNIDSRVLNIITTLQQAGFDAFLVGGGVRDLLLQARPKDFDIATNAHPEQIKALFRNCRLIGRRFRLAHIHFGREYIEVATFRGKHEATDTHAESGMVINDNVYGTLEEDAVRRDLTINALYYNPSTDKIVDLVEGLPDIKQKIIRIIGDPATRFREDPVRMLRVLRLASKLNFTIEPNTLAPISEMYPLLEHISPARLFEETLKIFHSGRAQYALKLLEEHHLITLLFPTLIPCLTDNNIKQQLMQMLYLSTQNTDARIQQQKSVTPAFLFAAFLWHAIKLEAAHQEADGLPPMAALDVAAKIILAKQNQRTAIPKRINLMMRDIWALQYRLKRHQGNRAFRLFEHPRFRAAYDFLVLRAESQETTNTLANWWTQFQEATTPERRKMVTSSKTQGKKRGKKRNGYTNN